VILEARDLRFRYGKVPVIRGVSFGALEGEILSILGPNGAGKTTLLKCLNRILIPRQGEVLVDGKSLKETGPEGIARKIGWVPQRGEVSGMKVYDLILLGRKPHFRWSPGRGDHRRVEEVIDLMGIRELSLRYADELSGGEFQMVQIVRALAQDPRVLLLDEPTGSLDLGHQHHLMSRLRSLIQAGGMTAVMTVHDINLALRYSDRFLILKGGKVLASGGREAVTPETIREAYGLEVAVSRAGGYPVVVPL